MYFIRKQLLSSRNLSYISKKKKAQNVSRFNVLFLNVQISPNTFELTKISTRIHKNFTLVCTFRQCVIILKEFFSAEILHLKIPQWF